VRHVEPGDATLFEVQSIVTQIRFHLRYLEALMARGWQLAAPRVGLTDFSGGGLLPAIEEGVVKTVRAEFPGAEILIDPSP